MPRTREAAYIFNGKKEANKALHRTAIPLRSIAAGELGRSLTRSLYGNIYTTWFENQNSSSLAMV